METSVKLRNMEGHFNDVLSLINDNQNIKRYLKYLSNNPLEVTVSQPNINESLINDNIVLSFFDEKIITEEKCFLFFNLLDADLSDLAIGEERYLFDIIIPNSHWILEGLGQFRAIRIAMELCNMLDQQNITGIGKIFIKKARCYKLNSTHQGCTLTMTVGTSNMRTL